MTLLRQFDRQLSALEDALIVSLTLLALALAFLQVVLRYVFNGGIHWLEAALVTALVWAMLMGAVRATREGLHPRVELVASLVPAPVRAVLNALALAATFALTVLYLKDSYFYAGFLKMIGSTHPELGIPDLYPFLVVPLTTALMALRQIFLAVALWRDPASHMPDMLFRDLMGDAPAIDRGMD